MFPRDQRAFCVQSARDINHSRRPEIGPGKLVFTGPADRDGFLRGHGEASGFDRNFTRVFATESAAGVRHDHSHLLARDPKRFG